MVIVGGEHARLARRTELALGTIDLVRQAQLLPAHHRTTAPRVRSAISARGHGHDRLVAGGSAKNASMRPALACPNPEMMIHRRRRRGTRRVRSARELIPAARSAAIARASRHNSTSSLMSRVASAACGAAQPSVQWACPVWHGRLLVSRTARPSLHAYAAGQTPRAGAGCGPALRARTAPASGARPGSARPPRGWTSQHARPQRRQFGGIGEIRRGANGEVDGKQARFHGR